MVVVYSKTKKRNGSKQEIKRNRGPLPDTKSKGFFEDTAGGGVMANKIESFETK